MRGSTLLLLVGLVGCNQGLLPSPQLDKAMIEHIERKLAALKCPGRLALWERNYWYSRDKRGHVIRSSIEIDLRQAGFEEFRRGMYIHSTPPDRQFDIDDREYKIAFGSFDVLSGHLKLTACGMNIR